MHKRERHHTTGGLLIDTQGNITYSINYPAAEQRGINRNIHNRPKGREIKPSAIFGGLNYKNGILLLWRKGAEITLLNREKNKS